MRASPKRAQIACGVERQRKKQQKEKDAPTEKNIARHGLGKRSAHAFSLSLQANQAFRLNIQGPGLVDVLRRMTSNVIFCRANLLDLRQEKRDCASSMQIVFRTEHG